MDIDELRPFRNRTKELLEFKSSPDEDEKAYKFLLAITLKLTRDLYFEK